MVDVAIHPTAIVDPQAQLGAGVSIGPFSIVEGNVLLGDACQVYSHTLIASGARLGADCRVHKGAVIGTIPQDLKFQGEASELSVGDRTIIREFCTLNRGTRHGGMKTVVGSDCLLMAYVHVAHDCIIGDHVVIANAVNMAGHIEIHDYASIGGMTVIHQFVKIGRFAFIGGKARVTQDVPPFILTTGERMKYYGPNLVGIKRAGFTDQQIWNIKQVYKYIYQSNLNLKQALSAIRSEMEMTDEVKTILDFIERSERGLAGR